MKKVEKIEKIKYSFTWYKNGPKDVAGNYPFKFNGPDGFEYSTSVLNKINELIDAFNEHIEEHKPKRITLAHNVQFKKQHKGVI